MEATEVISMRRAKRTLLQLVRRAAAGETVLIGLRGLAVAELTRADAPCAPARRLGFLKGRLTVPDDLSAPPAQTRARGLRGR